MKQRLQNMDVKNKKVIVRCDFNVPIKDGKILDDTKILLSLETLQYLIDNNCKVVVLSHLGKIKKEEDKAKNTLAPVAIRLNELLNTNVIFSKQTRSTALEEKVMQLKPKDVLILENTRYEDLPDKLESSNDPQLASYWASLADIFVMDAFGSSHRKHASTYGISKFIPSCVGFLIQKEIMMLDDYVLNAEKPFTILMGGAKIDDKLKLIEKLLPKTDHMLLAGGLANTALKSIDVNIGASLSSSDAAILTTVKELLIKYKNKIVLPLDAIVGSTYDESYVEQKAIDKISENDEIFDIGFKTIEKYKSVILESMTVFVNGTAGMYENKKYANGTKELFEILKESKTTVIVGGGDAVSAVKNLGYEDAFDYLSSGGGATLEYIINESLPALELIPEEK